MSKKRPKTREYISKEKHRMRHLNAKDEITFSSVRGHDDIFSMREEAIYASIEILEYYGKFMLLSQPQIDRIKKLAATAKVFDIDEAHNNIEEEK